MSVCQLASPSAKCKRTAASASPARVGYLRNVAEDRELFLTLIVGMMQTELIVFCVGDVTHYTSVFLPLGLPGYGHPTTHRSTVLLRGIGRFRLTTSYG